MRKREREGRKVGREREGERETSRIALNSINSLSTVTLIVVLVGSLDAINESAELRVIAQIYVPLSLLVPISIGRNNNELIRLLPEGGSTLRLAFS